MTEFIKHLPETLRIHKKSIRAIAIILVISLAAEVFLFNFRYFLLVLHHPKKMVFPYNQFEYNDGCEQNDGGAKIESNNATIRIPNVDTPVYNIKIDYTGTGQGFFTVNAKYDDDNFSQEYIKTGDWYVDSGVAGSQYINIVSSGKLHELLLTFSNADECGVEVTAVEFNTPYFNFRIPRFLLLFLVLCALYAFHRRKPWKVPLNLESTAQTNAFLAVGGAAILIASGIFSLVCTEYPVYRNVPDNNDNYMLMTEAFYNGRLSFVEPPPQELKDLKNPYDVSVRTEDKIKYKWDTAYYKGKYYSYFGVAPVITLLLPFKLLTGCYLSTSMACMLFEIALLVTLLMLYRLVVSKWYNGISFVLFLVGEVAIVFADSVLWLISEPRFYELAVISANLFFFLALTMLMGVAAGKKPWPRLLLAGLFFGLMVASRPNFVLYLLVAVPLLAVCFKRNTGGRDRVFSALEFSAPLAVIAVLLMAYNKARFGSVFEFGAKYQLTLNDPAFNRMTDISKLIPGLYHYLIEPFTVNLAFPFFHLAITQPTTMSQYYFNYPNAGVLNFPLLLILPAVVYVLRRMPACRSTIKRMVAFLVSVCAGMIVVDIMMAGVTFRYEMDILPELTLVAILLWFEAYLYLQRRGADVPAAKLFTVTVVITSFISLMISLVGESNYFEQNYSSVYNYLRIICEFWR